MQQNKMFNLVGVEIGVQEALNAKSIMEVLKPAKLFLIDPYLAYDACPDQNLHELYLKKAKKRMQRYGEKVKFIMKKSSEAITDLPLVDFVYVDGNHRYEFLMEDLKLYFEILRNGGIIGGHDFNASFFDVPRAVFDFTSEYNLQLQGRDNDFWIVKGS